MTIVGLTKIEKPIKQKHPREIARLDKIREEMCIPWGELNKLAREVIKQPSLKDVREMTVSENRLVILYMQANRRMLMDRYRKLVWNA